MLTRTHLLITIFFILLLVSSVENKIIFASVSLIAALIPDLDSKFSALGKKKSFRIFQFFAGHRGIFHSFNFLILISVFFALFFPVLSLGFFLGYSLHLFADSFTKQGIMPFYPYRKKISGIIKTGGRTEIGVFVIFLVMDLGLFGLRIFNGI